LLRRGILLACLTSFLWGTVPIAGRIALGGISASWLTSLRLLVAGVVLTAWLRGRLGAPPRLILVCALGLAANYLCYMWGLERTGPAVTQILIQTAPLFLVILGVFWLGERITMRQAGGGALALVGVFLVSWSEPGVTHGLGVALILLSALAWGVYAAAHKKLGRTHSSGRTIAWIFLLAGVATLPASAAGPMRRPDAVQVAAIAYLCLNTIVAYGSFAEALRHVSAPVVAIITTLGPVVTLALIAVTNRMDQQRVPYEALTPTKLIGAALVMGGVTYALMSRRSRATSARLRL